MHAYWKYKNSHAIIPKYESPDCDNVKKPTVNYSIQKYLKHRYIQPFQKLLFNNVTLLVAKFLA